METLTIFYNFILEIYSFIFNGQRDLAVSLGIPEKHMAFVIGYIQMHMIALFFYYRFTREIVSFFRNVTFYIASAALSFPWIYIVDTEKLLTKPDLTTQDYKVAFMFVLVAIFLEYSFYNKMGNKIYAFKRGLDLHGNFSEKSTTLSK